MATEEYRLSADEVACVKKLAERFEKGEVWGSSGQEREGLPADKREPVLGTMEHLGVIHDVTHAMDCSYFSYQISAKSLQVARAVQEAESKNPEREDIVERLHKTARRSPVLAWLLIGFFVVTAAITFVNQLLELLKKFGLFK